MCAHSDSKQTHVATGLYLHLHLHISLPLPLPLRLPLPLPLPPLSLSLSLSLSESLRSNNAIHTHCSDCCLLQICLSILSCKMSEQKRIILWCYPRTLSTAFCRVMVSRKSCKVRVRVYMCPTELKLSQDCACVFVCVTGKGVGPGICCTYA